MPIYEYRCSECGFEKDFLQKMSDAPLVDCPQCGKPALKKLISAAGFQLKGSGWYATDFRNSGASKPAATKSEGARKKSTGDSASAAGDTKSGEKAGGTNAETSSTSSSKATESTKSDSSKPSSTATSG